MKPSRRLLLQLGALAGAGAAIRWQLDPTGGLLFEANRAFASVQHAQTPLAGSAIPQFAEALTTFAGRRVGAQSVRVGMHEFQQRILPSSIYNPLPAPYNRGSYVWGYSVSNADEFEPEDVARASYPGTTIVARKGAPTTVRYANNLPQDPVLRKYLTIDRSIHWADPLNEGHILDSPYTGPIPTVVHLHGAEDQSTSDGAPEAWFTNNGLHGHGYFSLSPTDPNAAIYYYPNRQESTTLWFHDHSLGITRINVFSGLAAFYFIRDRFDTGQLDNPLRLPAGPQEIELMIQDRQFDTNGQLLFPDSAANPSLIDGPPANLKIHKFWIPEFFGDAVVVNGRTWPYLNVEPRRYRFRIVNASNARFYRMGLVDSATINNVPPTVGPAIYQIGTDGGLLDQPVKLTGMPEPYNPGDPGPTTRLFLGVSERADIIVDFAGQQGKSFTLTNDSQVPFPSGAQLDPADPTRQVMQFRVVLPLSSPDTTYNPANGQPLRGGANQEPAIVRLVDPSTGSLATGVHPDVTRQLVLFELESLGNGGNTFNQPVEDLVNNTKWNGRRDGGGNAPIPGSLEDSQEQDIWMTELPRVGSTEVWEILNLTVDAHPIHIHLIQFQLLNRQPVSTDPATGYFSRWQAAFPAGTFNGERADGTWGPVTYSGGQVIPGYGPPSNYFTPNADGALGGNPAFSPSLSGPVVPPNPNEAGWKDVAKVFPGFVNRYAIRWAPQATPINAARAGQNLYAFNPSVGPGYLVHCHILDHEDNEMMRPYMPVP